MVNLCKKIKEIFTIKYYMLYCEHCKKKTRHHEVAVGIIGGGWECMECFKLMDETKQSNIEQCLTLDRENYIT